MKVGILGAGQLARMLALAARPLGIQTVCLTTEVTATTANITQNFLYEKNNWEQIKTFAKRVDVITYETENIDIEIAERIVAYSPSFPMVQAVRIAQNRLAEKKLFRQLNIETAEFFEINHLEDLKIACKKIGFPAVLKTAYFGYDGKGQFVLRKENDIETAWQQLGNQALVLESFVPFEREVSLIAVRGLDYKIAFYPLTENLHVEGILRLSQAPYLDANLEKQAQHALTQLMSSLNYTGVLVVEFFVVGNKLLANEMAPRVHNSGHWTIEGAHTSQFENHIRAICGLPLGSTDMKGYAAMFNSIGHEPDIKTILNLLHAHFHTYEKAPREKRKLGHVNLVSENYELYTAQLENLKKMFEIA